MAMLDYETHSHFMLQTQVALSVQLNRNKKPLTASPFPNRKLVSIAAYPDQAIISFFLNISRTLHRRAENVEHRTSVAGHNYQTAQVDQLM